MSYDPERGMRSSETEAAVRLVDNGQCVRVSVLTKGLATCLCGFMGGILVLAERPARDSSPRAATSLGLESGSINVINSLAYLPGGRGLAATSIDGPVTVWDEARGRVRTVLASKPGCFVAVSPDGQTLAVSDCSRTLKLFDPFSGNLREILEISPGQIFVGRLAFSPDGRNLAASEHGGGLWLFDRHRLRPPIHLRPQRSTFGSVTFSPDGATLITMSMDGVVEFWSVADGCSRGVWRTGKASPVFASAPDGKTLVLGSAFDPVIEFGDVASRQVRARWRGHRTGVRALAFSNDGHALATAGLDGGVTVWDIRSGRAKVKWKGDAGTTWAMAFALNDKTLAVGGRQGKVRLWDLDGKPEPKLRMLAPDRALIESASDPSSRDPGRPAAWVETTGR